MIAGSYPNSIRFVVKSKERKMEIVGASIDGGSIKIQEIDSFPGRDLFVYDYHSDKP